MGFLGVCRAVYDYVPQAQGELAISEGDLLYILEKNGNDGWWKAKKKAGADDEEEPEGLVPHNYVEDVSTEPASYHSGIRLVRGPCADRSSRLLVTDRMSCQGFVRIHSTDRRRAFFSRGRPA